MLLVTDIGNAIIDRCGLDPLHAPSLIDAETSNVMRRLVQKGRVPIPQGTYAIGALAIYPLKRWDHRELLARAWALRDNLSSYDTLYVALAESLDAPLITLDDRMKNAATHRARIEVFA